MRSKHFFQGAISPVRSQARVHPFVLFAWHLRFIDVLGLLLVRTRLFPKSTWRAEKAGEMLARLPQLFAQTRDSAIWTGESDPGTKWVDLDWELSGKEAQEAVAHGGRAPSADKKRIAPTRKDTGPVLPPCFSCPG